MSDEELVGAWRVVSHCFLDEQGATSDGPCGPHAAGLLIYDVHGFVSAALMRTEPADEDATGPGGGPPATYMGYSGRWQVKGDVVVHEVVVSSHSRIVNTEQVRDFRVDGDRLTLRERLGDSSRFLVLEWQRA